jgi:hypothetical protein
MHTSASAADYPTWLFLSGVSRDPIGVGPEANVSTGWIKLLRLASGPSRDRWQGWKMTITDPSGHVETLNLVASDAAGSGIIKYTPDQVGTYTFKVTFPGQNITQNNVVNWYKASESATVQLTVQEEQIKQIPFNPLPTEYWSRPLNAQNHGWNVLAGNWLGGGSAGPHGPRCYDSNGNFKPIWYST